MTTNYAYIWPDNRITTVERIIHDKHYNGFIHFDGHRTVYQWEGIVVYQGRKYTVYNWSYQKDKERFMDSRWSERPNFMTDRQQEPPERVFEVDWFYAEYPEDNRNELMDADHLVRRVPWMAPLLKDPSLYRLDVFEQVTVIGLMRVTVKMLPL